MFSQGQLVFAGFFFVAFVIAMIFAYRKDSNLHRIFYKGNYKILIGFILFIIMLFIIKIFFKR
jgi:cytochrome bd-type quinol oxidase subunit 1